MEDTLADHANAYIDSGYHAGVLMNLETFQRGSVRGFVHKPDADPACAAVLAHGAGSNANAPLLVRVAEAMRGAGYLVLRCDLPYRQARPSGPPFPAHAAADREGLREAAAVVRELAPGARVVVGGHSYGGRQASMLAAEDASVADALLLMSYPLHPPRKRDQLRTGHFPDLRTPVLFVHGTRDPFGSPEEMAEAVRVIPRPVAYSEVKGAGHELGGGKFDVAAVILEPLALWIR
jgi:predicted alpha/beta-hydrolase family hydrolase